MIIKSNLMDREGLVYIYENSKEDFNKIKSALEQEVIIYGIYKY